VALLAIWFFGTLVLVIAWRGIAIDAGNPFFTLYLAVLAYGYFGYCWSRSGQTLGMKSWKIRLVPRTDEPRITWRHTLLRFTSAIVSVGLCGLGYLWALIDADGLTWHDRISATRLRDAG
jgi:uncharacterized RDD family membrane protein YckC